MSKEKKYLIGGGVAVLIIVVGLFFLQNASQPGPSKLDSFAKCIANSGAKFYGAFWCPHCAAQKSEFGSAVQYLPYIECSNPDGLSQDKTCNAVGIQSYPTWVIKGATTTGVQTLDQLSEETGCQLPSTAAQQ